MRLSLALWTSLLSVSVLADPGKSWADKGDDGHHFSDKNWRHKTNNLKARTHTGTFTGFVDPEVPDVNQWLGVPYGAPPTGDQRFLPPKPAAHAGDISTTEYKPICMQNGLGTRPADSTSGGIFWALVPEFQNQDPQSEDCLYLNIWGPRKSIGKGRRLKHQKKVPVIIWSEWSNQSIVIALIELTRVAIASLRWWISRGWRTCSVPSPGSLGPANAVTHRGDL